MADQSKDRGGSPGEWNAREIARRNSEGGGRPLSPVMKTAATACELAHSPSVLRYAGSTSSPATQDERPGKNLNRSS